MKKKRTYSRKRKALRWLIRLAVLILLLNVLGIYKLNPDKAIVSSQQQSGIASVETIHREKGQYEPLENWLLLVGENRDVITLNSTAFSPLNGWYNSGTTHAILRANPETHDRSWIVHSFGDEKAAAVLFGFVPDGEQAPTFKAGIYDYRVEFGEGVYEDLSRYTKVGNYYFDNEPYTVTPTPTIPVQGGMCYLVQIDLPFRDMDRDHWDTIVLCDRTGQWEKCKYWTSSWLT